MCLWLLRMLLQNASCFFRRVDYFTSCRYSCSNLGRTGVIVLPFVATADGIVACTEHCCKPDDAEIQANEGKTTSTKDNKTEEEHADVDPEQPSMMLQM